MNNDTNILLLISEMQEEKLALRNAVEQYQKANTALSDKVRELEGKLKEAKAPAVKPETPKPVAKKNEGASA